MKALVLSGGAGTRLRPLTHTSAKQLVPIANEPILFYGLRDIAAAGISDVAIVVGETRAEIEAAVGDGSAFGLRVTYVPQDAPRGLAHCVLIARDVLGDEPFLMYLGDNMLEQGAAPLVHAFEREQRSPRLGADGPPAAHVLLAPVDDPRSFGVAELAADGHVVRFVEKPDQPESNLALVGVYAFDARVHEAVRSIEPSARGELEITDALQWLLDEGHPVASEILSGWWLDTGKKDDLLHCNRLVLDRLDRRVDGRVRRSRIEGRVVVEAGASIEDSTVRGPAVIGRDTTVKGSYVGPYTSIGADCVLDDCEIEHSVILDRCRVTGVHRLRDSLLGRDVEVVRGNERPPGVRLLLGDHSTAALE
jgi:glucose-1-phosphate thymidylyltransferase